MIPREYLPCQDKYVTSGSPRWARCPRTGQRSRGHSRKAGENLLYLGFRRGTQVAQGRGLQNLHSWVRIPPAPPASSFQISGLQLWFLSRHPQLGNIGDQLERELRLCFSLLRGSLLGVSQSASLSSAFVYNWFLLTSMVRGMHQRVVSWQLKGSMVNGAAPAELRASRELVAKKGPEAFWRQPTEKSLPPRRTKCTPTLPMTLQDWPRNSATEEDSLRYLAGLSMIGPFGPLPKRRSALQQSTLSPAVPRAGRPRLLALTPKLAM